MSMTVHKKRRIEIMIEAPALKQATDILDRFGATGYTVLPALSGRGTSGSWRRDDAFADVGRIVSVVCITDASRVEDVLIGLRKIVERHIGIVSVCDVDVIRSELF